MNKGKVVVDTCVVDYAFIGDTKEIQESCYKSVSTILKEDYLYWVLDYPIKDSRKGKILEEYWNKLGGIREFEIFIKEAFKNGTMIYVNPTFDDDIMSCLDKFHLQEEDRMFVFTALASEKILITEDGDFGVSKGEQYYKERFEYFTNTLGMTILNSKSFLEWIEVHDY